MYLRVTYDGTPASAGKLLFATGTTNRRVWTFIPHEKHRLFPSLLEDCCGTMADWNKRERRWDWHITNLEEERHTKGVATPLEGRDDVQLSYSESIQHLCNWASKQNEELPGTVMREMGIHACPGAEEQNCLLCSHFTQRPPSPTRVFQPIYDMTICLACTLFAETCSQYGVYLTEEEDL